MKQIIKTMNVSTTESEAVDRGYGYFEKQLNYNGRKIHFKAICHIDEIDPIDIVSTNHRFIPHEELEENLQKRNLYIDKRVYSWNRRRAYFYVAASDEAGVIVTNSIDRSMAVNVHAYVGNAVLAGKVGGQVSQVMQHTNSTIDLGRFSRIYRMHTKEFDMEDLIEGVENIMDATKEFEYMWNGLYQIPFAKSIEFFDDVKTKLPKKYCANIIDAAAKETTLGTVYEKMCSELWNSKIDGRTKIMYYSEINDAVFACWLVEKG